MKFALMAAIASAALAFAAAPASAQQSHDPDTEKMVEMGETMAAMFTSEPLTPEQEARLPAATAIVEQMMPKGFYAEIMDDAMESTLMPMMAMLSGASGADLVLGKRIDIEPAAIDALSDAQKIELAILLDPGFAERGPIMQDMMNDVMREIATAIEPGFREGMAKAYAVRFDPDQLADIAAFFATPTGEIYARESMRLMTDPQVMSASMQAMPAMMEQFGGMEEELTAAMEALPTERGVSDLSEEERARMATLLGVEPGALAQIVSSPSSDSETGGDSED